jgi:hypothetical protein
VVNATGRGDGGGELWRAEYVKYCCLNKLWMEKKECKGTDKSKTTETYLCDASSNDPIVCASEQEFV